MINWKKVDQDRINDYQHVLLRCEQLRDMSRDMTKQQNECASSEDSDQPGHPPSLIRVFAVHSMGS